MQLIFILLVATWFLFKSIEIKQWRYLFISGVLIGLGFNIKMLQAYMVVPAFVIIYLIFATEKLLKKLCAGFITIGIMVAVSLSWSLAVELYPTDSRPYVDSSTNNSVFELIIGHNGLERIYGQGNTEGVISQNGKTGYVEQGQPPNNVVKPQNGGSATQDVTEAQQGVKSTPQNHGQAPQGGMQTTENSMQAPESETEEVQNTIRAPANNLEKPPMDREFTANNDRGSGGGMGSNEIGTASIVRLWSNSLYGQ